MRIGDCMPYAFEKIVKFETEFNQVRKAVYSTLYSFELDSDCFAPQAPQNLGNHTC